MRRSTLVSLGLVGTWAVHDVEELLTMPERSQSVASRMPTWLPIPEQVRRDGLSREAITTGVALMAGFMTAAAVDGVRSAGRGWFFQTVLAGYGLHGLGHLGSSAALRTYTSGAATSPVVVLPYWLWARRQLRREGVPLRRVAGPAIALTPAVILAALAVGHALTRRSSPRMPHPSAG